MVDLVAGYGLFDCLPDGSQVQRSIVRLPVNPFPVNGQRISPTDIADNMWYYTTAGTGQST
jgi:hypothetical protein